MTKRDEARAERKQVLTSSQKGEGEKKLKSLLIRNHSNTSTQSNLSLP